MTQIFSFKSKFPVSALELFEWHEKADAFSKLIPPWEKIEVVEQEGGIKDGAKVHIKVHQGPIAISWKLEHYGYSKGKIFNDRQTSGPFKSWKHSHIFHEIDDNNCYLEEHIEYEIPLGILGSIFASWFIKQKLKKLFEYRHRATYDDIQSRK